MMCLTWWIRFVGPELVDRASLETILPAMTAAAAGVLPMLLIGGLDLFISVELGYGRAGLDVLVAASSGAAAVAAIPAGRLVASFGRRRVSPAASH